MPDVIYLDQAKFRESMINLRKRGGASQRAYNEACKIMSSLQLETDVSNKHTKHGENRINHCVKYDISNDAHRLVTVHSDNCIYLLYVGSHDDTEKWLNRNRGLTITCNPKNKKITVTHITKEERRDTPAVNFETIPEANTPYFDRIGFDPAEYVSQRILLRALKAVNDDTTEEELTELSEDLNDSDPETANLMLDVILEIRSGDLKAATARIEKHRNEVIDVLEDENLEQEAISGIQNSEDLLNLTGLTEEELKELFSPDKFDQWMLFLHPEQKRIAEANYDKPVVLTGVSGSGKTCVLVHRARYLAKKYPDQRIGVITLNRSLTHLIDNLVTQLCTPEERENIHVMAFYDYFEELIKYFGPEKELQNLKKIAIGHPEELEIMQTINRVDPQLYAREFDPLSGEDLEETWKIFCDQSYTQTLLTYVRSHLFKYDDWVDSKKYLRQEFSLIRSALPTENRKNGYLDLKRNGRAIPFTPEIREKVLNLLLLFEETMLSGGLLDELSLTLTLVPHLSKLKSLPPTLRFHSLLIDEVQDLSTRDLALLRLIPTSSQNGLFVTGDTVQRVLVKDFRLGAVGLDVISSTWEKITKNYRNSRQILETASLLSNAYGAQAQDLGEEIEILDPELAVRETNYPVAVECIPEDEVVRAWEYARSCLNADSATPWSICIVTASEEKISTTDIIKACPEDFPVKVGRITGDYVEAKDTLSVGTMSDVKGFEFSLVLIVGCGATSLPSPGTCIKESWREALRLYVAMTRARDEVRFYYSGKPSEFLVTMTEGLYWEELDPQPESN